MHDYTCWRTFSLNSLTAHDFISSPHLTSVEGCGCVSARRARRKKRNHFPVVQPCLRLLLREQQTEARQVKAAVLRGHSLCVCMSAAKCLNAQSEEGIRLLRLSPTFTQMLPHTRIVRTATIRDYVACTAAHCCTIVKFCDAI